MYSLRLVNKLGFYFLINITALEGASKTPNQATIFTRMKNSDIVLYPTTDYMQVSDMLSCARMCSANTETCYGFFYNTSQNSCRFGGWLLLDKSVISNTELIYTQLRCIRTGYTKKYRNNTTACLLVSTTTANYSMAEKACTGPGTRLYTVKTQDKLDVLLTITRFLNISFWIGLDDRANEGQMKWSDNTVLNATWENIILPPSNKGNQDLEDCVEYNPVLYPFNDNDCSLKNRYICEMTTAS